MASQNERNRFVDAQNITCCLKIILSVSFFVKQLKIFARGYTNAALPTNTRPKRVELTAIEVKGLMKEYEPSQKNWSHLGGISYRRDLSFCFTFWKVSTKF